MRVSRQGSRSCTVRHISGNGCCRREADRKTIRNLDDSLKLKLERRIFMNKIYGVVILVAMLIGATMLLERTVKVAAAPAGIKNVVLVHGAFADGSGWEAVAKILEKDGYTVSVAQPPETSYAEDIKSAKAAVDAMNGPVVIVGHSYGGGNITHDGDGTHGSAPGLIPPLPPPDGGRGGGSQQATPPTAQQIKPGKQQQNGERRER